MDTIYVARGDGEVASKRIAKEHGLNIRSGRGHYNGNGPFYLLSHGSDDLVRVVEDWAGTHREEYQESAHAAN